MRRSKEEKIQSLDSAKLHHINDQRVKRKEGKDKQFSVEEYFQPTVIRI